MPARNQGGGHQPAVDKLAASGEPPAPPTGGSGVKPAADPLDKLGIKFADITPLIEAVIEAVKAKAGGYSDHGAMRDQQRADRVELLSCLATIFTADSLPAMAEGVDYHTEVELVGAYVAAFRDVGLFLLPNVVETMQPDPSGNVTVIVEFALASTSGAYWPAAVRVSGMGNDRVATNRGGTGDKALPRALSGAWKEAIHRLGLIAGRNDPEKHDAAHLPLAGTRPSNQVGSHSKALSVQAEDEFRNRFIEKVRLCTTLDALDKLENREDVKAKWSAIGSRTRKTLMDEIADQKRRIRDARSNEDDGGERGGYDRDERDESGGRVRDDRRPSNDPDDDIPF